MKRHLSFGLWLSAAVLAVAAPHATAQCVGPDNLNGPCWDPVVPNLPTFPNTQLEATNVCWTKCVPTQQCSIVDLGPPTQTGCTSYFAQFTMSDCSGQPLLSGLLQMEYTRTWEEVKPVPPPNQLQVWRFAVKIDMTLVAGAPFDPCAIPSCFSGHPTAFYYGYADYAFDCATNQWEQAVVLFHNCDEFIHDQQISDRPGTFHPDRTYAIVAPSTPLNPFVASMATPPTGPMIAEGLRQVPPPGVTCNAEDLLGGGDVQFLGDGCGCEFALNPKQLNARRYRGFGSCTGATGSPSSFFTLALWPSYPWYHMMTTSIGSWTTTATYPGPEFAWVDEGAVLYHDSCDDADYGEIYYGGSTGEGYDVVPGPILPLSQNFTDVASNASFALPGGPTGPLVGSVMPTRNLIYVNVP